MATTPNYNFPYPSENDPPNGAAQIGALATAVDTRILNTAKIPICQLKLPANQSIPTDVNTAVLFGAGSENIDTHGFHSTATNTDRVIPNVPGYYMVQCHVSWATSSLGNRRLFPSKNGVPDIGAMMSGDASQLSFTAQRIYAFNGTTDYASMIVYQTAGIALNIAGSTATNIGNRAMLEVYYLRPL